MKLTLQILLLRALSLLALASADDGATTGPVANAPAWALPNALRLSIQTGKQYRVIPLAREIGLNVSDRSRDSIIINGKIIAINASNFDSISANQIALLSCDVSGNDGLLSPSYILSRLLKKPTAIILYSTKDDWCSFAINDRNLEYTSVLSTMDHVEASFILGNVTSNTLNGDSSASITNIKSSKPEGDNSGNNSTIAMIVLYCITGIITVLFLVIIATGTIRAHRNPERYGPRRAIGGQPRQSRAKGLARAVLDTIPIVKFGQNTNNKTDPEVELQPTAAEAAIDAQSTNDGPTTDANKSHADASGTQQKDQTEVEVVKKETLPAEAAPALDSAETHANTHASHVGCSICTEDFEAGEDVRVLPCSHQFHPICIDPWLINVSGTCPLCRLDLQPGSASGSASDSQNQLPPPLALDPDEFATSSSPQYRNRLSRLIDVNRLRLASTEEQIETLRQMRTAGASQGDELTENDDESRRRGARLAAKLKDTFRIRTRAQASQPQGG